MEMTMAVKITNRITRFAGDTYPTKTTISINGNPVDLTDWHVMCKMDIPLVIDNVKHVIEAVIDCVVDDAKEGKVKLYPHARYYNAVVNGNAVTDKNIKDLVDGAGVYTDITTELTRLEIDEHITDDMDIASGGSLHSNQCWTQLEVDNGLTGYPYRIVREKTFDTGKTDAAGNVVLYRESMTHTTGVVEIIGKEIV